MSRHRHIFIFSKFETCCIHTGHVLSIPNIYKNILNNFYKSVITILLLILISELFFSDDGIISYILHFIIFITYFNFEIVCKKIFNNFH